MYMYLQTGYSLWFKTTHTKAGSENTLPNYSDVNVGRMGDNTLTLVFSNTCHTCPLMSAFLQGNEYL